MGDPGVRFQRTNHDDIHITGYSRHRENRENGQKEIPVRENTGNLEMLPKHRKFGLLKFKFPDLKLKDILRYLLQNFHFFYQKLNWSAKSVLCI